MKIEKCCYFIHKKDCMIDTHDKPDYGDSVNIEFMSDDDFYNNVFVFYNGMLLANKGDFWRVDNSRSELIFYRDLRVRDVVQIVVFQDGLKC